MGNVRVGVVGAGVMGRTHADAVRMRTSGASLAAVSDPNFERALIAGAGYAEAFEDALAVIESPDVDAVIVASPDDHHAEHVAACVRAGKPVLCEKPLAATAADCRMLLELEAAAGRPLIQVGYMRRYDPAYVDLRHAYLRGAVGLARIVRCVHRNARAPAFFRADMALSNAMVHEFDILRWLLNAEILRIRVDRLCMDGQFRDDPIVATVQMDTGALANVEVFMNAGYGYDIGTEIVGEAGLLIMGAPASTRSVSLREPEAHLPPDFTIRFEDAYARQIQEWVNWVGGGLPPNPMTGASAADGLKATLVAEAGERALISGQWETVETATVTSGAAEEPARAPETPEAAQF